MVNNKSYQNFIQNANIIYNNKYSYKVDTYKTKETKMMIECIKHNHLFTQSPKNHLKYEGCKYCRIEHKRLKNYNIFSTKIKKKNENFCYNFKKECEKIFKNIYNYQNTYYINDNIEINVICDIHGLFRICPKFHLLGFGCEKCEHLVLHDN